MLAPWLMPEATKSTFSPKISGSCRAHLTQSAGVPDTAKPCCVLSTEKLLWKETLWLAALLWPIGATTVTRYSLRRAWYRACRPSA